jgi:prepilin-type N-terminal cleavage/methylation domain-containing protein
MIRRRRLHRAFTLVEQIVVIAVIGLLAAAVAMSFSAPVAKLRAQDAVQTVRMLDEGARMQARRSGKAVQIVIDLSDRTLARRDAAGETVFQAQFPSGVEVDRFRSRAKDISSGEAVVTCAPLGLTRTYAVHVRGPGLDQWLLFAGLSGEATLINDEATLDSIFAPARGHDAR